MTMKYQIFLESRDAVIDKCLNDLADVFLSIFPELEFKNKKYSAIKDQSDNTFKIQGLSLGINGNGGTPIQIKKVSNKIEIYCNSNRFDFINLMMQFLNTIDYLDYQKVTTSEIYYIIGTSKVKRLIDDIKVGYPKLQATTRFDL